MSAQTWFESEEVDGVTVVRLLHGVLRSKGNLAKHLLDLVEHGKHLLVLNFSKVEWMDSTMFGRLLALRHKVRAAGGQLALCHLNPDFAEIFETRHFDKLFEIHDSETDAVASLKGELSS